MSPTDVSSKTDISRDRMSSEILTSDYSLVLMTLGR